MVPVTIRPPHPQNISTTLPTVKMIAEVSKSVAILTNSPIIKMLKTKVSLLFYILVSIVLVHLSMNFCITNHFKYGR